MHLSIMIEDCVSLQIDSIHIDLFSNNLEAKIAIEKHVEKLETSCEKMLNRHCGFDFTKVLSTVRSKMYIISLPSTFHLRILNLFV